MPAASALAAREGLTGLEFGVNIPGTVGGAVRMNANAYGGDLARVLEWVDVVDARRRRAPRARRASASPTAARTCSRGRSSRARRSRWRPPRPPRSRRTLAQMRDQRREAASPRASRPSARPSRTPTTSARRAAPRDSCSTPPAAGELRVGGARFSQKHANFVENAGEATTRRRAGPDGGRARSVRERFGVELEAEVQLLGDALAAPDGRGEAAGAHALRLGGAVRRSSRARDVAAASAGRLALRSPPSRRSPGSTSSGSAIRRWSAWTGPISGLGAKAPRSARASRARPRAI